MSPPEFEGAGTRPAPPVNPAAAAIKQQPDDSSLSAATADIDLMPAYLAHWRKFAHGALEQLAASLDPFTVDDVIELVGDPPNPRQISGVFAAARRRNLIEPVGSTVGHDGRLLRLWRGAE